MQVGKVNLTDNYSIQVFETLSDIGCETWNTINAVIPFYQSHGFLSIIENIQKDIQFRYVLISRDDKIMAALYVQLLDFSFRNLVNYSGEQSVGWKGKLKSFIAGKNTKVLNLGNVFFTGDKGIISINEEEVIPLIPGIFTVINKSFTGQKPSAALVANIYLQDASKCLYFYTKAFHPFATEPDMFMNIDGRWSSFEHYMDSFSSKYRVRAKKVLSVSSDIIRKEFSLDDIAAQKPVLEKLYNNVVNHVAFNMATLNIDFFERVKSVYADQCKIHGYYLNDVAVGFTCLFQVDPGTLHVHYIGLDYEVNKEKKLYNRMLLDFVRFALDHKLDLIHFGRTATEIKTTIGAEPRPLNAYLKMNNRLFNASLPYFLERIRPAEFVSRNPFKE